MAIIKNVDKKVSTCAELSIAIIEGVIPRFMGVNFHVDTYMPNDDVNKDVGLMFDKNFFLGTVVGKDMKIGVHDYWNTGQWEFTVSVKLGAAVLREYAGIAFYS